jgi:hypothetical protein
MQLYKVCRLVLLGILLQMKLATRSAVALLFAFAFLPELVVAPPKQAELLVVARPALYEAVRDLPRVLAYVHSFDLSDQVRYLAHLDLFSGQGEMHKTWHSRGYAAERMDILIDARKHDLTNQDGFFNALQFVLCVLPFGLITLGPPCSWWIFLSSCLHQRTKNKPSGNTERWEVHMANILVENMTVVLIIATLRWVWSLVEQPLSSAMIRYWSIEAFRSYFDKFVRVFSYMGAFGHAIQKPSYFLSNLPGVEGLKKTKSQLCLVRVAPPIVHYARRRIRTALRWFRSNRVIPHILKLCHHDRSQIPKQFYKSVVKKGGTGKWIFGLSELKETAAYTEGFCGAVFDIWLAAFNEHMSRNAHKDIESFNVSIKLLRHVFYRCKMPEYPDRREARKIQCTLSLKPTV